LSLRHNMSIMRANNMKNDVELDLHGVKHQDVKPIVIRFIEENWSSGNRGSIVTGHSEKMKTLVIEVLDEYKLPHNTFRSNYPKIDTMFE